MIIKGKRNNIIQKIKFYRLKLPKRWTIRRKHGTYDGRYGYVKPERYRNIG